MPQHPDITFCSGGSELLDRIEVLWSQLRHHHAELAPPWSGQLLRRTFQQRTSDLLNKSTGGILVLLATICHKDVGYCVSTIDGSRQGEIDSLFVVPSHRRTGIGRALMDQTMQWFDAQDVRSIYVDVMSGNDAAVSFYARYGFLTRTLRLLRQA